MEKKITCPSLGCFARLEYEENPETGRILGATACSLIEGEVDCDQICVRRLNMRREALLREQDRLESERLVSERLASES